ncbi:terpene synthase family protein [Aspergillus stella-maris]|uniref:terpene synthase family protein n=1 Tax=Aspergillus stella-maris TaxID=1810926 RepID=UPI003CCD2452
MTTEKSVQDTIWSSLEGQSVKVPNLLKLLPPSSIKLHLDYEKARDEELNPWIRRYVDNDKTCRNLQNDEFGLFAAAICADASYEKLCTVAKFFAWYYLWDDLFDFDTLKNESIHGMGENRLISIEYIKHQILPSQNARPDLTSYPMELQKALMAWDEVGVHIRDECSEETRELLCTEMVDYMSSVGAVNALFEHGQTPTVEEYWKRRDRDAGVYPGIATIPFVAGIDVTAEDVSGSLMKEMWKQTSYIVHIANDMISLQKELEDGQIENLIPILMLNNNISINHALQEAYNLAEQNMDGFCRTSRALASDEYPQPVSGAFAKGCGGLLTGLLQWSYNGGRYLEGGELDAENVFHFQIPKRN